MNFVHIVSQASCIQIFAKSHFIHPNSINFGQNHAKIGISSRHGRAFQIYLPELKELWSNQTNWVAGKKYKERRLVEPIKYPTLITLLRLPYLCHFGSTSFALPNRPKYGILNRVIRVFLPEKGSQFLAFGSKIPFITMPSQGVFLQKL